MGVRAVYTPKDFALDAIITDVAGLVKPRRPRGANDKAS
jgi:hypothetical protein